MAASKPHEMLSKHTLHAVQVGKGRWIVKDPNGNPRSLFKRKEWLTRTEAEEAILKAYSAQFDFGSIK